MEIGTLGPVYSLASKGNQRQPVPIESQNGFSGLLSLMMESNGNGIGTGSIALPGKENAENLRKLDQFFQVDDLFEIEGGMMLIGQVQSTSEMDLLEEVLMFLGISETEWQGFVEKLNQMNGQAPEVAPNAAAVDGADPESILVPLLAMADDDFAGALNNQGLRILKALKLYDLLAKHQDSFRDGSRMAGLVKEMAAKIETVAVELLKPDRQEFLQKVFRPIVSDPGHSLAGKQSEVQQEAPIPMKMEPTPGQPVITDQMSRPEQLALMLNKTGKPASAEQLIQQFENILARSHFSKAGGIERLIIRLHPEHLGALRVELIQKDQAMIARILTSTGMAKHALESQVHGLKQAFASQHIQIEKVEVLLQAAQEDRLMDRREQEQHHERRQKEEGQARKEGPSSRDFNDSFEEALLNMEV